MINLELSRYAFGLDSTLGRLYASGAGFSDERSFVCFVLEDQVRTGVKVRGETAVPVGTYEIALRTEGGMHGRYSEKWPEWHKGMLWLQKVPGFEFVYLHPGNTDDDSLGCLLPGSVPVVTPDGEFRVVRSVEAYRKLYLPCVAALSRDERVALHIYDAREALAA